MNRKVVVALIDEAQEVHKEQASEAKTCARRLGLDVQVVFAENNALVQIHQLFGFIHAPEEERPAALVVFGVKGEGLARVGRNAVRAGIGWIVLNRTVDYIDGLRSERPDLPIAMIGVDQAEAGRIQGRQVKALAPRAKGLLCVQGPPNSPVVKLRLDATREVLAGMPLEWRMLTGDWTEASGEHAVSSWLRLATSETWRPDVIVCQNDAMAEGVRSAVATVRPDWRDVPLLGCDGLRAGGQALVERRLMTATVILPQCVVPGIEIVQRWLATGQVPPAQILFPPQSFPPEAELASRT